MSEGFPILVDARGVSRAVREAWLPALEAEAVWYIGDPLTAPDPEDAVAPLPILSMTAFDLATAWLERADADTHVVAVVDSVVALLEAANNGLPPTRVFLVYLDGGEDGERLAASVVAGQSDLAALRELADRGFEMLLQALPRVTARRWAPRG